MRTSWKRLLRSIADLCVKFEVQVILLGLPLRLDGSEGDATHDTKRIARNLRLSLNLPVYLQDERYTSKEAESMLREEGYKGKEINSYVDSNAAAIILSDFLWRPNDRSKPASECDGSH